MKPSIYTGNRALDDLRKRTQFNQMCASVYTGSRNNNHSTNSVLNKVVRRQIPVICNPEITCGYSVKTDKEEGAKARQVKKCDDSEEPSFLSRCNPFIFFSYLNPFDYFNFSSPIIKGNNMQPTKSFLDEYPKNSNLQTAKMPITNSQSPFGRFMRHIMPTQIEMKQNANGKTVCKYSINSNAGLLRLNILFTVVSITIMAVGFFQSAPAILALGALCLLVSVSLTIYGLKVKNESTTLSVNELTRKLRNSEL